MNILKHSQKLTAILTLTVLFTSPQVTANAQAADPSTSTSSLVSNAITELTQPAPAPLPALRTLRSTMTAYNSTPNQTDDSPFVTASGSCVRDGVVASNDFRIGTKIRLPELFGDKIFVVEDRMNERYSNRIDVWMTSMSGARQFGLKRKVQVEVVEEGNGKKHWNEGWTNEICQQMSTVEA